MPALDAPVPATPHGFRRGAFPLVLAGLQLAAERASAASAASAGAADSADAADGPQHVGARALAEGVRDVALAHYGPLARLVLADFGLRVTRDIGCAVLALCDAGVILPNAGDRLEQFDGLFDFADAFETHYPWAPVDRALLAEAFPPTGLLPTVVLAGAAGAAGGLALGAADA